MKKYFAFWAKKKSNTEEWLPLFIHLVDAGLMMGYLWDNWVSKQMKNWLIDNLYFAGAGFNEKDGNKKNRAEFRRFSEESLEPEEEARQLMQFLGALHDVGKASYAFSFKTRGKASGVDCAIFDKFKHVGLIDDVSDIRPIRGAFNISHAKASEIFLNHFGIDVQITSIIGGHHGQLKYRSHEIKGLIRNNRRDSTETIALLGDMDQKMWLESVQGLYDDVCKFFDIDAQLLPLPSQPAQLFLNGMLIMADWIVSNEEFYPYISLDQGVDSITEEDLFDRLEKASRLIQLPETWQPSRSGKCLYQQRFGRNDFVFKPYPVQEASEKVAKTVEEPGLLIIEAAMGSGKTEAALVCAEHFAEKTGATGLFFALPTQATSDGLFQRLLDWLETYDKSSDYSIHLAHGKSEFNEAYSKLKKASNIYEDPDDREHPYVHTWFEGSKKSLLDNFVVGTVDQLLLSVLKMKHFMLRSFGLANKIVVVDEVHAYDAYMNQYLLRSLKWLGSYHVPVILLSATLPKEQRKRLANSYMLGYKKEDKKIETNLDPLETVEYPLITYSDGLNIHALAVDDPSRTKKISIIRESEEGIIGYLKTAQQTGGNVGIILNTVARAQAMTKRIIEEFGSDNISLLHSRFLTPQRMEKEAKLLSMLGSKAGDHRPEFSITIGTQIFEQSFNVDFDVLITDLAPMDLLIQRIGRLHRFELDRPSAFRQAQCVVISSESCPYDDGSACIYCRDLLEQTLRLLPETIELPKDISPLVQACYDVDSLKKIAGQLEEKDQLNNKKSPPRFSSHQENLKDKAKVFLLESPKQSVKHKIETIHGLLGDTPIEAIKGISRQEAEAAVRDTEPSFEVILLRMDAEGSLFFEDDGIIKKYRRGQFLDDNLAKAMAKQRITLSDFSKYNIDHYIYELEKWNLENYSELQNSSWLKGELILTMNQKGEGQIDDWHFRYTDQYGLERRKEKDNAPKI